MADREEKPTEVEKEEEIEEEEDFDNPDGLLKKKKKKKNQVCPETDVVTSKDEQKMAMKKVLELEKELLDMRSEKNESEEQVKGLKYELGGLQKTFKDLQDTSAKSLEDIEKFEVKRLTDEVAFLKTEITRAEKTMTEHNSIEKERDLLRAELDKKIEEMKTLQTELTQVKDELKNLKESSEVTMKLNEEREKVKTNENEMKVLKNEIEKMVKEKEEEKTFRMKIAARLKLLIDEKNKMESNYKMELHHVSSDFEDLKKHLIHITSDKAEMFQKLSDIVFEKAKKQRWVSDVEAVDCTNCREKFSFTLRKHHCRLCGHIFCSTCSDRWLITPHSSKRVRSCDVCADAYCDYYESSGADKDCVDAPPEYREVKGDELNQYEAEEEEEIKEEETKIEESEGDK